MTLSGRAALERPDVDALTPDVHAFVFHLVLKVGKPSCLKRTSIGPDVFFGAVHPVTGTYRAAVNQLTETQRRAVGVRRNGQLRRRTASAR